MTAKTAGRSAGKPAPKPEPDTTSAPQPPAQLRVVAGEALKHHAAVASVLSIALFGYARLTVALLCWPMGLAPSDLDLSFQDYLLIAALWFVFLALPFAAIKLHGVATRPITELTEWPWYRRGARFSLTLPLLLVVFLAVATSGAPWSPGTTLMIAFAGFIVLFVGAFFVAWALPFKARPIPMAAGVVTVFIAISGCVLSFMAGSQLHEGPANHRPIPLPLQLALGPSEGLVTIDGQQLCAVRVAPRVYVTTDKVIVAEATSFAPSACHPGA